MRTHRVVALLVLAVALLVSASFAATTPPPDPAVARLSKLNGPAFDAAFLQAAIPINDEAIEIAMTATLYADHPELLHWNQNFVEREREQVRQMLDWLQTLGSRATERNEGVATAPVKKLRTLRGAALERAYIPLMTQHLDRTVVLARLAAQRADRPALRAFAAKTVTVEGQDASMLRGWLRNWYH